MGKYSKSSSKSNTEAVKGAVVAGVLGVVFTPMMQSMVTDANITGIAGTILGYVPMIIAAGVILHQFEYF